MLPASTSAKSTGPPLAPVRVRSLVSRLCSIQASSLHGRCPTRSLTAAHQAACTETCRAGRGPVHSVWTRRAASPPALPRRPHHLSTSPAWQATR
jgi:hypothetical protein